MPVNRWWDNDPDQLFWLEITDRGDLGVDLNAPQVGRDGKPVWHYSLIHEVNDGDIVFHYHMFEGTSAIMAWSRASGTPWADVVNWAPHAGDRTEPLLQDGWRLALEGYHLLDNPVTFEQIRQHEGEIRSVEQQLSEVFGNPLYTPFEVGNRPIRPKQAYLVKLPKQYLEVFPSLRSSDYHGGAKAPVQPATTHELAEPYRRPNEAVMVARGDPFEHDPELVERALRSHASTQNAVADYLLSRGLEPRSPGPKGPNFDVAWAEGGTTTVVEVKSLSDSNEESQLRYALGQVLRYRHSMATSSDRSIRAAVVTSREPSDPSWLALLAGHGVVLAWPGSLDRLT